MCNSYYYYEAVNVLNYTLEIPNTISAIEEYAFSNLGFQTYIFKGTKKEFLKIAPDYSFCWPVSTPKITFTDESNPLNLNSVIKIY